jgi:6-phosphofructokinase 1
MHFIVEVMGRHCGDIATAVGKASGAEAVLIPESESNLDTIYQAIHTQGHNIIVVAEGDELGGAYDVAAKLKTKFADENLNTKIRVCVLGHIQRGGSPSARDRILAHEMGIESVNALLKGEHLKAVGVQNGVYKLTQLV